ncbi:class I SAM-dependent methyltransferase [bacterium]|nr:class I SAM-dependent methyltransferase [bacterium]
MKNPYERYEEKPFPGSSHTWAFNQLRHCTPESAVLDIGPGSGILGKHLSARGVRDIAAVEVDEATREKLGGCGYSVIVSQLSELPTEKKFDVVLLLDVLEHMADPFGFLQQLEAHLQEEATVLISVPNITHLAIRVMVLCGFFEYMERGPLDRTHLQFFSSRRFHELLRAVPHYHSAQTSGTLEPLELFLPPWATENVAFRFCSKIRQGAISLWPSLFAYQYVGNVRVRRGG